MYEDEAAADEALEAKTTDPTAEDDAEAIGDGISMPTLQRGNER